MSTVFQKYAAALLPFFVLVVGASQTVLKDLNWNNGVTFAVVVVGAIVTYLVRLLPYRWQGATKTGAAIVTAILSAVLPFVLPGGFDPKVNAPVIVVAVLNAIATELGVQIRVGGTPVGGPNLADPDSQRVVHRTVAHKSKAA